MTAAALHLVPGSGLLVRRPSALLFSSGPDTALVEAFGGSDEGGELQALASATVAAGFALQPFVGIVWANGLRVMAFGDIAVETDQPTLPMISGAGSRTWVEHTVALGDGAVVDVGGAAADAATDLAAGTVFAGGFRLELGGAPSAPSAGDREVAGATPRPAVTEISDATAAVPRPESVEASTERPPPPPPPPPAPVPAARVDVDPDDPVAALAAIQAAAVGADGEPLEPTEPARRGEDVQAEGPREDRDDLDVLDHGEHTDPDVTLPPPVSEVLLAGVRDVGAGRGSLVEAKQCANGHANPPTAASCAVCGELLAPGTAAVVHVARPSLGRLQFDDGELVDLDQELLVGRNPDRDTDPARSGLRRVKTLGEKVSRSHLEVRFQDWDVLVADCGSTNGTFVVPHPGGQVVALEPGRPQIVEPGAVVYFGSRSFTVLGRESS